MNLKPICNNMKQGQQKGGNSHLKKLKNLVVFKSIEALIFHQFSHKPKAWFTKDSKK